MEPAFGVQIDNRAAWSDLRAVAETMDRGRWNSLYVFDHLLPSRSPRFNQDESTPVHEAWTLLGGFAAVTRRLQLGCLVSANTFRNPALLAKMGATLHSMSDGRAILGIGAAWQQREHEAYGIEFYDKRERSDRLYEAAQLIRALLLNSGPVDFEGRYYRLVRAPFAPRAVDGRPVPLMVGGSGEKRTLRTLARFGDVMNVHGSVTEVAHKLDVLRQHCAEVGRDPREIRITVAALLAFVDDDDEAQRKRLEMADDWSEEERMRSLLVGSAAHIVEVARRYHAAGVDEIILQGLPVEPAIYERIDADVMGPLASRDGAR